MAQTQMNFDRLYSQKMHSDNRVIILERMEGENIKSNAGLIDNRLFQGENNVYATRDPQTSLWSIRYDKGVLPGALKQQFTKLERLIEFARGYFARRGVRIVEVKDA